jgi:hypothetical protein
MLSALSSVLSEKFIAFILSNRFFAHCVTFWDWIKNHTFRFLFLLLGLITSGYAIYEYQKPKIHFKYNGNKINDEILQNLSFEFNDKPCKKNQENKKLIFICDEPFKIPSTYYYKFNNKKKDIYVDEKSSEKPILFNDDPNQYMINTDKSSLTVKNDILKVSLYLEDKSNSRTKFPPIGKQTFQICGAEFDGNITNSTLKFDISMSVFSNAYYNDCKKTVDFVIDEEDYKYKKKIFLYNSLKPQEIFPAIRCDSNRTNSNTDELNQCIYDHMSIKDNKVIITKNSTGKIPNINLFNLPINESNNSYLKFTLDDLTKDTALNFSVSGESIFRFNKDIIKFPTTEPQSIKKSNKHPYIKKATIVFHITDKKYSVEIVLNSKRQNEREISPMSPFKYEGNLTITKDKNLIHQISIESPNLKVGSKLLTISDIETGDMY